VRLREWRARDQARLMVKMLRDPTALGDLWSGQGIPAGDGRGRNWEDGREWCDDHPQWYGNVGKKKGQGLARRRQRSHPEKSQELESIAIV